MELMSKNYLLGYVGRVVVISKYGDSGLCRFNLIFLKL